MASDRGYIFDILYAHAAHYIQVFLHRERANGLYYFGALLRVSNVNELLIGSHYEWAKPKFLLTVMYRSPRRHSNSSKTLFSNLCYKNVGLISLIVGKLCTFRQCSNIGNFQQFCHHNFRVKGILWILMVSSVTGKFLLRKFHLGKFHLENSSYGKFLLWKKSM